MKDVENKELKGLKQNPNNKLKKYLWHVLLIAITLVLLLFTMICFEDSTANYLFNNIKYAIVTFSLWICQYFILKGITNKTKLSLSIVIATEVIYDIINSIIRTIRGAAITISDIYALKTALTVSKNVNFQIKRNFILGLLFIILTIGIVTISRKKFIEEKNSWKVRIIKIIAGIMVIFGLTKTNIYNSYTLWDMNEAYRTLGTPVTILRMLHDFKVKVPEGYDKIEVKNLMQGYETINTKETEDTANIIVIINESFCDYYNMYNQSSENPIQYFLDVSKGNDVISGVMYSSEFGGQTSNVEYEFLTQNSTKILPRGSFVFQQYITKQVEDSLVQHLKKQGYKTSAMHPWEKYAYSRNKIYPFFGFDSIKFKDDIEGLESNFNNDFISDRSTYKELIRQIREKKKEEKIFEYVLTVQNHTGYINPDPKQIIYSNDNSKNVYMQLIHESSEALRAVIEELKKQDEKYVLLFFGDHQPSVDNMSNSVEMLIEQYEVPFLIWANFDIEEQYNVKTSTIFLQNYLLKVSGVKYSAMNNYMEELQKYYTVITKSMYIDANGNIYKTEDVTSQYYDKLQEYSKIDYYRMFDCND